MPRQTTVAFNPGVILAENGPILMWWVVKHLPFLSVYINESSVYLQMESKKSDKETQLVTLASQLSAAQRRMVAIHTHPHSPLATIFASADETEKSFYASFHENK